MRHCIYALIDTFVIKVFIKKNLFTGFDNTLHYENFEPSMGVLCGILCTRLYQGKQS